MNKVLLALFLTDSICWGSKGLGGEVYAPIQFESQHVSWIVTNDCPPLWYWNFKDGSAMDAKGISFLVFSMHHLNQPFHNGIFHPDATFLTPINITNGGIVYIANGIDLDILLPSTSQIYHQVIAFTDNQSVPGGFTMTPGRMIYKP